MRLFLTGFALVAALASFAGETVVFTHPNGAPVLPQFRTGRPEQAMPFGAGSLSAMVSFGTDALELHLSRPDYVMGGELPSPGHLTMRFPGLALTGFRQVMDVDRGEVRLSLKSARGDVDLVCAGDRETGTLVVEFRDARPDAARPEIEAAGFGPKRDPKSGRTYDLKYGMSGSRLVISPGVAPEKVLAVASADLEARRLKWWRAFWSRARIELEGDPRAERLARLWRINLYCWANVGYGELPPKFNGGPGLVFGDSRKWGAAFWWQNTRELIWPMCAAGYPEFAKSSIDLYEEMRPNLKEGYLPETVGLDRHPISGLRPAVDPDFVKNREKIPASFTSHVFSSGAEYVQQVVEYMRYTGDRSLESVLAQWTKLYVELYLRLLEKGADGRWHVKCTNVNESWWKVDDSLVDLCAVRFTFTLALAHGARWGLPDALLAQAKERLGALAPFPTCESFRIPPISPTNDYAMTVTDFRPGDARWTTTWLKEGDQKRAYAPNEMYIVYPFAMTHADENGADRERAVNAYRELCEESDFTGGDGYYLGFWGWDHMPVAAVRLRLPDAAEAVYRHMERTFRWPFGGAKSPAGVMYEGCEVEDAPYFDGSGVMMTALQEMLLQSHAEEPDPALYAGGPIRLLPAVPRMWSGSFRLCARGGFVVDCAFRWGRALSARVTSTRGGTLRYADPQTGRVVTRETRAGESLSLLSK